MVRVSGVTKNGLFSCSGTDAEVCWFPIAMLYFESQEAWQVPNLNSARNEGQFTEVPTLNDGSNVIGTGSMHDFTKLPPTRGTIA